jgi:hypothetical protein
MELSGGNIRPTLLLPIHWASMTSSSRLAITGVLADLSEGLRGRVIIEIFGMPAKAVPRDLIEVVRAGRQLGREVALRVRLSAPKAQMAADCGITMITVDMTEMRLAEGTTDAALVAALDHFRDTADRASLGCCAWGIRRRAAIVGTVQGGYAMVNGPALMKDLPHPGQLVAAPKYRFAAAPA